MDQHCDPWIEHSYYRLKIETTYMGVVTTVRTAVSLYIGYTACP